MQLDPSTLFVHASFQIAWRDPVLVLVLPGESGSQGLPKREWNNWKGRIASESTLSLVASVYDELENMLDAAAPHQILAHGQGWSSIVSGDVSKGSRLEKVVARLCRCGITTVMQARRRDELCEIPRQRGAKRASTLAGDQDGSIRARDGTGINADHPRGGMKQYGQMLIKGWNRHHCSPSPRCRRLVVFGGITYLRQCFFHKSMQLLSRLGASFYVVQ